VIWLTILFATNGCLIWASLLEFTLVLSLTRALLRLRGLLGRSLVARRLVDFRIITIEGLSLPTEFLVVLMTWILHICIIVSSSLIVTILIVIWVEVFSPIILLIGHTSIIVIILNLEVVTILFFVLAVVLVHINLIIIIND
jgi:hypothetical protein